MKNNIVLIVTFIILVLAVYNGVKDENEMHDHQEFFTEMREFMNKGERFSLSDGKRICEKLNKVEEKANVERTDCNHIYGQ